MSVATTTAHSAHSAIQIAMAAAPPAPSLAGANPAAAVTGRAAAVLTATVHSVGLGTNTARATSEWVRINSSVTRGNGPTGSTCGTAALTSCRLKPTHTSTSAPTSIARSQRVSSLGPCVQPNHTSSCTTRVAAWSHTARSTCSSVTASGASSPLAISRALIRKNEPEIRKQTLL